MHFNKLYLLELPDDEMSIKYEIVGVSINI